MREDTSETPVWFSNSSDWTACLGHSKENPDLICVTFDCEDKEKVSNKNVCISHWPP